MYRSDIVNPKLKKMNNFSKTTEDPYENVL